MAAWATPDRAASKIATNSEGQRAVIENIQFCWTSCLVTRLSQFIRVYGRSLSAVGVRRLSPADVSLFEFDRLERSGFVERCAPDLVRGLVLGPAVAEPGAESEIEVAHVFERVDQR